MAKTSYFTQRYKTVHMPDALFQDIERYVQRNREAGSAMAVVRGAALLKIQQYMHVLKKGDD